MNYLPSLITFIQLHEASTFINIISSFTVYQDIMLLTLFLKHIPIRFWMSCDVPDKTAVWLHVEKTAERNGSLGRVSGDLLISVI